MCEVRVRAEIHLRPTGLKFKIESNMSKRLLHVLAGAILLFRFYLWTAVREHLAVSPTQPTEMSIKNNGESKIGTNKIYDWEQWLVEREFGEVYNQASLPSLAGISLSKLFRANSQRPHEHHADGLRAVFPDNYHALRNGEKFRIFGADRTG